jgi:hypothetical protein
MAKKNLSMLFWQNISSPMSPTNSMIGLFDFLWPSSPPITTNQKLPVLLHSLLIMVVTVVSILMSRKNGIYCRISMPRNMSQNYKWSTHWSELGWASLQASNQKTQINVISRHLPIEWEIYSDTMWETLSRPALLSIWNMYN